MTTFKLAAIQAESKAATMQDRWVGVDVAHALDLLDRAHAQGAQVACFPELYPTVAKPRSARAQGAWVDCHCRGCCRHARQMAQHLNHFWSGWCGDRAPDEELPHRWRSRQWRGARPNV